jgi:TPR repeat protein
MIARTKNFSVLQTHAIWASRGNEMAPLLRRFFCFQCLFKFIVLIILFLFAHGPLCNIGYSADGGAGGFGEFGDRDDMTSLPPTLPDWEREETIEDQYLRLEQFPTDLLEERIERKERDVPVVCGVLAERYLYGRINQNIDKAKAFDYATRAYKAGDVFATLFLARMYADGEAPGGENLERSQELYMVCLEALYSLSREERAPRSQYYLALYLTNRGPKLDVKEALRLLRLSADGNYAQAQFLFGKQLIVGELIDQNIDEGLAYIERAANQGHVSAELAYGIDLAVNRPGEESLRRAIALWRSSARKGNIDAQFHLASILERGFSGVPGAREEAIENYNRAAAMGHRESLQALERLGVPYRPAARSDSATHGFCSIS